MARPFILYKNAFDIGSTTADNEDTSYPISQAIDYRPFVTNWKPATLSHDVTISSDQGSGASIRVDTCVIIDHNLSSCSTHGARWMVQKSVFGVTWLDATDWVSPSDDKVSYITFAVTPARQYWRILIENRGTGNFTSYPYIGHTMMGERLTFTEGLQPGWEPLNETAVVSSPRSEGGLFLGTSLKYMDRTFQLNWESTPGFEADGFFDEAGIVPSLDDFWKTHAGRGPSGQGPLPFFFCEDEDRTDPFFCRIRPGSSYSTPYGPTYLRRGLALTLDALVEL